MAQTVQPTSSPTFVSTISVNVIVVLQDNTNTRVLREGVERKLLEVNEQCTAALENTFKDLLSTTDATDVTIASITQDAATGETIVVLTTSVDTSTSEAAVSEAIEGAFSSGAFDAALATNLEGLNCPELAGLTYQSVDIIACAEPNLCSGLNDTTSCVTGTYLIPYVTFASLCSSSYLTLIRHYLFIILLIIPFRRGMPRNT